jgi:hypothetical protein
VGCYELMEKKLCLGRFKFLIFIFCSLRRHWNEFAVVNSLIFHLTRFWQYAILLVYDLIATMKNWDVWNFLKHLLHTECLLWECRFFLSLETTIYWVRTKYARLEGIPFCLVLTLRICFCGREQHFSQTDNLITLSKSKRSKAVV